MKFEIEIRPAAGNYYVLLLSKEDLGNLGLNVLDKIRAQVGLPLLADRVKGSFPGCSSCLCRIEIPEELARKSGKFLEKSKVEVFVKPNWLNKYTNLVWTPVLDESTGEILEFVGSFSLKEEEVKAEWESLGFPTEIKE